MSKQSPIFHQRRAGILLHPTSLPSGILDDDVERWLKLLADSGFSVWQVMPLGDPHGGLSPYQCTSAFAMNPLLLPEYPAYDGSNGEFTGFCEHQKFWLDDYAVFKILKQHFNNAGWNEWPAPYKFRQPDVLRQIHQQYARELEELKWQQYQLHKRWQEIRRRAASLGILLFGDMPIFIAYDSADVWAHPELFLLDDNDNMTVVTGVPPDYFSATGQRWGNPHYNWKVMMQDDYAWWRARTNHLLEQFDIVRIDHFRGLEAAWMIDAACETAVEGYWQKTPGDELLSTIKDKLEQLPFVAEDLGIITPEVTALRKKFHLPGMSILQFGFDEFDDNPHKPKNITEDTIVYTGTHDNDTTKGWFNNLEDHVKNYVLQTLNLSAETAGTERIADRVVDKMVDNAMASLANICIIPFQDVLYLGTEARMNVPGTTNGNWRWQFQWQLVEQIYNNSRISNMRNRIQNTNRLVNPDQE
jgi:4-alpha-glucanotransferase